MATFMAISTPLRVKVWESALSTHPDHAFSRYICDGLQYGFRVGFKYGSPLKSASSNMGSAHLHPEVISNYIPPERAGARLDVRSLP